MIFPYTALDAGSNNQWEEHLEISTIEWHQSFYFAHTKFAVLLESSYE